MTREERAKLREDAESTWVEGQMDPAEALCGLSVAQARAVLDALDAMARENCDLLSSLSISDGAWKLAMRRCGELICELEAVAGPYCQQCYKFHNVDGPCVPYEDRPIENSRLRVEAERLIGILEEGQT